MIKQMHVYCCHTSELQHISQGSAHSGYMEGHGEAGDKAPSSTLQYGIAGIKIEG